MQIGKQQEIEVRSLTLSPSNPRTSFDEPALASLTESVRQHGILQPLLVRPREVPMDDEERRRRDKLRSARTDGVSYEVIAGNRRLKAAIAAGLEHAPCIVVKANDGEALQVQLVENLQREDLPPLDEAAGLQALVATGTTAEEAGLVVSRSDQYVRDRIRLLHLSEAGKEALAQGKLPIGHAVLISRLAPSAQKEALKYALDGYGSEVMPLVHLRRHIDSDLVCRLSTAPFAKVEAKLRKDGALLIEGATYCAECPRNTGNDRTLFPELTERTCLDRKCFQAKTDAAIALTQADLTEKLGHPPKMLVTGYVSRPPKGALHSHEFKVVAAKDKPCKDTEEAVIVAGPEKVGQALRVCTNRRCKQHWEASQQSSGNAAYKRQQAAYQRKTDLARRVNQRLGELVVGSFDDKFKRPDWEDLARVATGADMYYEPEQLANTLRIAGISVPEAGEEDDGVRESERREALAALLPSCNNQQLARFVVAVNLDFLGSYGLISGNTVSDDLRALAERRGIDVAAIEAEEKARKPEKPEKKGKGKAAAGAAKPTPAKTAPDKKRGNKATAGVMACTVCGCTESTPCAEGCAWVPADQIPPGGIAPLCTACAEKIEAGNAAARAGAERIKAGDAVCNKHGVFVHGLDRIDLMLGKPFKAVIELAHDASSGKWAYGLQLDWQNLDQGQGHSYLPNVGGLEYDDRAAAVVAASRKVWSFFRGLGAKALKHPDVKRAMKKLAPQLINLGMPEAELTTAGAE